MKREIFLQKLANTLGISLEEAEAMSPNQPDEPNESIEDIKPKKPKLPIESTEERLMEAQAALNYFLHRGNGTFYRITCSQCGLEFVYTYSYLGITMCSIECMSQALETRGLRWTPNKPLHERWGFVAAPAVVPGLVLQLADKLLGEEPSDRQNDSDSLLDSVEQSLALDSDAGYHSEELDQFLSDLDL